MIVIDGNDDCNGARTIIRNVLPPVFFTPLVLYEFRDLS
jgi:hypothetical protein